MRLSVILTVACMTTGVAGVVLAQPKAMVRPMKGNERAEERREERDNRRDEREERMCMSRRQIRNSEQKRFEGYQAEVAGLEAEIASLQRRLDDMKKQRDEAKKNLSTSEKRAKKADEIYARECKEDETCGAYDSQAVELGQRTDDIERELEVVRTEIKDNRTEIGKLESRIAPLQKEYSDKKCNNLVPGETDQATIDRCSAIFSDWNRLQGDLNRANNRVPALRSHYESLLAELTNLEKRASLYEQYLARNCTESKETAKMRGVRSRREKAQTIGQELDSLIADITKLRGVKITVTAQ